MLYEQALAVARARGETVVPTVCGIAAPAGPKRGPGKASCGQGS
ncbi:hypothetical protein [Solidesulfovibrio sp. C21]